MTVILPVTGAVNKERAPHVQLGYRILFRSVRLRADGYGFWFYVCKDDPTRYIIKAGCRTFRNFSEAYYHWGFIRARISLRPWVTERHNSELNRFSMVVVRHFEIRYEAWLRRQGLERNTRFNEYTFRNARLMRHVR